MQKINVQIPMGDIHGDVSEQMRSDAPKFLKGLKEHIKMDELIPARFRKAYYKDAGRPRNNRLESFIWLFVLKNMIGIADDSVFLRVLAFSRELYDFCGFATMPKGSDLTAFRERFCGGIELMFHGLVDVTEPICRALDGQKAGYGIYDTSGVEANVRENNPKFMNTKLNEAKKIAKNTPGYDAHKGVYALLPETSAANPFVKHQYIDGHFCYAYKFGIVSNGLGIVRHIAFFDERFKDNHPETVSKKTDDPDLDKEIGDSTSLAPVLSDFFEAHPGFKGTYHTFLGDSSFDSYDIYPMLMNDFGFQRMCIPLNLRNSSSAHQNFAPDGTPLCPVDNSPFVYDSVCNGKNRSLRFKFLCPKSSKPKGQPNPVCSCDHKCTQNSYKCTYVYPSKNLRLYPGIPRGTPHWDNLYRHRVLVERSINTFKHDFGLAHFKSFSAVSAKANLFLAGITQLFGLILAVATNQSDLFKSIRKLISAA